MLDGLRGVAVLLVLLSHAIAEPLQYRIIPLDSALKAVFNTGWIGVDLFFVLSGFLITGILLDMKGETTVVVQFRPRSRSSSIEWKTSFYQRGAAWLWGSRFPAVLVLAALVLALSYLLGWLSYHVYEKQFLALKQYFAPAGHTSSKRVFAFSRISPSGHVPRRVPTA